jgi:hypothetical protein
MQEERSIFSEELLKLVREWIKDKEEIYVVARYSHMAGGKEYYFFSDFEAYCKELKTFPPMTDVILFLDKQLPYRAVADDELKNLLVPLWKKGDEWSVVEFAYNVSLRKMGWDSSLQEIDDAFAEMSGRFVACGLEPSWWLNDHSSMQSGLVPFPDGTLQRGCY